MFWYTDLDYRYCKVPVDDCQAGTDLLSKVRQRTVERTADAACE
jgi:hypothetical protein